MPLLKRGLLIVLAVGALLWGLAICGEPSASKRESLTILAASSLTEGFERLAAGFEAEHPELDVQLVFAGSQVLRMQVQAGAPGDVMATAHPEHLEALRKSGHAEPAQDLIQNRLALVVHPSHPEHSWRELSKIQSWILGSAQVPIGQYSEQFLQALGAELGAAAIAQLRERVRSREPNVRLVRAKVAMGQADAAIVYGSDVRPGAGIKEIPLPAKVQPQVRYDVATLTGAVDPQMAQRFVDYARSEAGQALLVQEGFVRRKDLR